MVGQNRNRTVARLPLLPAIRKRIDGRASGKGVARAFSSFRSTTAGGACCLSRRGRTVHIAVACHLSRRPISGSGCKGSVTIWICLLNSDLICDAVQDQDRRWDSPAPAHGFCTRISRVFHNANRDLEYYDIILCLLRHVGRQCNHEPQLRQEW